MENEGGIQQRQRGERERVEGIAQNNCQGRPIVEKEERKKRTLSPLCLSLILYILQPALTLKRRRKRTKLFFSRSKK